MENSCITEDKTNTAISCKIDSRLPIIHPVVLGGPETSISLDTEASSLSGSESDSESEWTNQVLPIGSNSALSPTSINVESSTDVVIGPLTQFHGPVTIYQTVSSNTHSHNETLQNHKIEGLENSQKYHQEDQIVIRKLSKGKLIEPGLFKWILLLCLILAVIGVMVVIGVIETSKSNTPEKNSDISFHNLDVIDDNLTVLSNFSLKMHNRADWFGVPALNFTKPLKHPTEYVVISHTDGTSCTDFFSCSAKVKNIQTYHMLYKKAPDIGYNFLIGGDGEVYVGMGWNVVNIYGDNNIAVSIIGEYVTRDKMTPQMISALDKLLQLGLKLQKLAVDYKVLCHNQIMATASPGENVCDEVAKFSHYYPGRVTL